MKDEFGGELIEQQAPQTDEFGGHLIDEQKSLFERGISWLGTQLSRVPAAIRGTAQAYQDNDAYNAANMAWQGFKDPESVQSFEKTYERAGVPNTPTPRMRLDPKTMKLVPGIPDAERVQAGLNPDGSIKFASPEQGMSPGLASGLGYVTDAAAPTGLEGLPIFLALGAKMASKTATGAAHAAAKTVDAVRGGNEAASVLEGAKEGLKTYGARQAAKVDEVLNPKLAPDADRYKAIGQALGLTPEELAHPAIEYGELSVPARRNKVLAQGDGGGPILERHNAITEKIQRGFDNSVQAIGGPPMEPVQAGQMIRQGVINGAKRIASSVTANHNDIIEQFPGLMVNGAEMEGLTSKINGVEKFAKGRAMRGVVPEQRTAAQTLLNAVDAIRNSNGSYKQLNEAREMIGDVAFDNVGDIAKIPTDIQKLRDLYFGINDALIGTVGKTDRVRAGQFRAPGTTFEPIKEKLIESNKILHEMFQDESAVGRALGNAQKAPEAVFSEALLHGDTRKIQALRNLLTPEEFAKAKGAYINALIKKGKEGFTYKAAKNTLAQNRSVVGELFSDRPDEIEGLKSIIDLGDRVGAPLLPGSAGQLEFGGVSKLVHKLVEPVGDVTSEIGKARAKNGARGNWDNLKNLPIGQALKALRVESDENRLPPYLRNN
jgi:hypothetical protein